jgi:hypothetical protein
VRRRALLCRAPALWGLRVGMMELQLSAEAFNLLDDTSIRI